MKHLRGPIRRIGIGLTLLLALGTAGVPAVRGESDEPVAASIQGSVQRAGQPIVGASIKLSRSRKASALICTTCRAEQMSRPNSSINAKSSMTPARMTAGNMASQILPLGRIA